MQDFFASHCFKTGRDALFDILEEEFADFSTAQKEVAIACSTYNYLRPHSSIDPLKPAEAHQMRGEIRKRWKNYYSKKKGRKPEEASINGILKNCKPYLVLK